MDGYYDKEQSSVFTCTLCPERYARCSSESTGLECKGLNRKNLSPDECACLDGYYEDSASDGCIVCPEKYSLCTDESTG